MTEPSKEELMARIAELEKQTGSKKQGSLEFKVGGKGGVSVYGMGRFPVTLYYEQWVRLLDAADGLRAFLEENKSKLKLKEQSISSSMDWCRQALDSELEPACARAHSARLLRPHRSTACPSLEVEYSAENIPAPAPLQNLQSRRRCGELGQPR